MQPFIATSVVVCVPAPSKSSAPLLGMQSRVLMALPCLHGVRMMGALRRTAIEIVLQPCKLHKELSIPLLTK